MQFTSKIIALSSLSGATFIPFLNATSRHFDLWLSGTNPDGVYFAGDVQATTVDDTAAQLTSGMRYRYHSAQGIPGIWVLAAGGSGQLNVTAY